MVTVSLHGAALSKTDDSLSDHAEDENIILYRVQCGSFAKELDALQSDERLPNRSCPSQLDPEYNTENCVI